jgi:hypothetical protein
MPELINFHCVWVPADKCFHLSVGKPIHKITPGNQRVPSQFWHLKPAELEATLKKALAQLTDATDSVVEFSLDFPVGGIRFQKGREAFSAIVDYLVKVYDGWEYHYKRSR